MTNRRVFRFPGVESVIRHGPSDAFEKKKIEKIKQFCFRVAASTARRSLDNILGRDDDDANCTRLLVQSPREQIFVQAVRRDVCPRRL